MAGPRVHEEQRLVTARGRPVVSTAGAAGDAAGPRHDNAVVEGRGKVGREHVRPRGVHVAAVPVDVEQLVPGAERGAPEEAYHGREQVAEVRRVILTKDVQPEDGVHVEDYDQQHADVREGVEPRLEALHDHLGRLQKGGDICSDRRRAREPRRAQSVGGEDCVSWWR